MNTKKRSDRPMWLLLLLAILLTACTKSESRKHTGQNHQEIKYYCPMHPEVVTSAPGLCPICGMELQRQEEAFSYQLKAPNKQVLSRQSTVRLRAGSEQPHSISVPGYATFDRDLSKTVAAPFSGRVEKLFVKYEKQYVRKGQKVMELYSPDLNTFQEEHLLLLTTGADSALLKRSREKLRLLGLTITQIHALEKSKKTTANISVFSPAEGYFSSPETPGGFKDAPGPELPQMEAMGASQPMPEAKAASAAASQLRAGSYITKGQSLFSVNDISGVWVVLSIPVQYRSTIYPNQVVRIVSELYPDKVFTGTIALIEQAYQDENQRFVRARVALPNSDRLLKINSLVKAEILISSGSEMQLPSTAIYRTGLSAVVWVKTGTTPGGAGIFKLRKVSTGPASNGKTTITGGLSSEEEVAGHAGYMADSETYLIDY